MAEATAKWQDNEGLSLKQNAEPIITAADMVIDGGNSKGMVSVQK